MSFWGSYIIHYAKSYWVWVRGSATTLLGQQHTGRISCCQRSTVVLVRTVLEYFLPCTVRTPLLPPEAETPKDPKPLQYYGSETSIQVRTVRTVQVVLQYVQGSASVNISGNLCTTTLFVKSEKLLQYLYTYLCGLYVDLVLRLNGTQAVACSSCRSMVVGEKECL